MDYTQIKLTSVRHNTYEEGKILHDLVLKYKPKNILEIGTFGGYNTLWLAYALDEASKDSVVYSIDYYRTDVAPTAKEMITRNNLSNVFISSTDNIIESLNAYLNNASMIFIDECHDKMQELLDKICECSEKDKIIIFHDVLCDYAEMMKTPKIFGELKEKFPDNCEIIETKDDNGNLNGFGIYHFRKFVEKQRVEKISEELAISVNETSTLLTAQNEIVETEKIQEQILEEKEPTITTTFTTLEDGETIEEETIEREPTSKEKRKYKKNKKEIKTDILNNVIKKEV